MQHLDPDTAALVALGETAEPEAAAHLASCSRCAADVDELRDVVLMARDAGHEALEQPSPLVWEAISRELDLDGPDRVDSGVTSTNTTPGPQVPPSRTPADGQVSSLDERRSRRSGRRFSGAWLAGAGAAAVGVVAGGGALWAVDMLRSDDGGVDGGTVVARTDLAGLPGYAASGAAEITRDVDGVQVLDVSVEGQSAEGYREVWLIAPDLTRMYSLGVLEGDQGSFTVPDDIDLAQFPIVDVSDEPYDGDPTHSTVSMVRGTVGSTEG